MFCEWLEENKDRLIELLRNDPEQALYEAWCNGYDSNTKRIEMILRKK